MSPDADVAVVVQEEEVYAQRSAALREELEAMRAAATQFDKLHREAAGEVGRLRAAQTLEQGQAQLLLKQGAALKRENHLLKVRLIAAVQKKKHFWGGGGGAGGGICDSTENVRSVVDLM